MSQETLRSNVWSNETLQLGAEALKHQLVKVEEEDLEKSLEDLLRQKAEIQRQQALETSAKEATRADPPSDSRQVSTQLSTTSPYKIIKKSRVEEADTKAGGGLQPRMLNFDQDDLADPEKFPDRQPLDHGSQNPAAPGECPEHEDMQKKCEALEKQMAKLTLENEELHRKLEETRGELEETKAAAETAALDEPEAPSDAAVKKRLMRICERKADGTIRVPEEVHKAWANGGADRKHLEELLVASNFNKAEFLKSVTVEKERKEQVKFRVRAQWATETKMREVLKLKESRIRAIVAFCERHGQTEYDKYEGTTKYWVEDDAELEVEKTRSRRSLETMNYEVQADAAQELHEAGQPLSVNPSEWTGGMSITGAEGQGSDPAPKQAKESLLPRVVKNEAASTVILKYMEGITKRAGKLAELAAKYESIPEASRSAAQSALITKLQEKVSILENTHGSINEVYSCGAVEGYTAEQEANLLQLYKVAMKEAQDALTLESRAKSIPLPKGEAKSKAGPKAKAKVKAKAAPEPAATPKKAAVKRAAKK